MSSRPFVKPYPVVNSGDMSSDITSNVTIIQMLSYISYGLVWTGSPVGNFSIEASNDYEISPGGQVINAGTWVPMDFLVNGSVVNSVAAGGAAGDGFFDIPGTAAYAVRFVYTSTSGSGTIDVKVNGKVS